MENKLPDEVPKMTVGGLNGGKDITYIPFRFLDENQAQRNHSQSLQRLNERGGLGYSETMDIITGKPWATFLRSGRTEEQAAETVKLWLKKKYAAETASPAPIEAGRGEVLQKLFEAQKLLDIDKVIDRRVSSALLAAIVHLEPPDTDHGWTEEKENDYRWCKNFFETFKDKIPAEDFRAWAGIYG